MSRSSRLLVEVVSDNPRSRNTIEFAIEHYATGNIGLGQGGQALLAVVDCEGANSFDELRRYHRRHPQRPVVLLLSSERECATMTADLPGLDVVAVITKPLKVDTLIKAIENSVAKAPVAGPAMPAKAPDPEYKEEATLPLPGGFAGLSGAASSPSGREVSVHSGDIDLRDSVMVDQARVWAGERLLGRLQTAIQQLAGADIPLLAEFESRPLFCFLPETSRVAILVDSNELQQLAQREIAPQDFVLRPHAGQDLQFENTAIIGCEALFWRLALLTYRGGIPDDVLPLDRVYLTYWPNLTRLDPIPDSLRIAALWSRMPADLDWTARALGVPQKHVLMFYAAARAIGLAGPERRRSNCIFQHAPERDLVPHATLVRLAAYLAACKESAGIPSGENA